MAPRTNPRKLNRSQVDELATLRERGWSYKSIAAKFNVSPGTVYYHCLREGAISPRQRCRPVPTEPHSFIAGDGRRQSRFTQADDARLLQLEGEGFSLSKIAREMQRPRTSVRMRLMLLALREELPSAEETF